MSDLFRRSVKEAPPPRPKPKPVPIPEDNDIPDHPPSDSSSSSADSTASVQTVRPSSREHEAPPDHWSNYFSQELYLHTNDETSSATYHVYLTPPTDAKKGPLFICHHGAGTSALSFAVFAQHIKQKLPHAGILSLEARGHGSIVTKPRIDGNDQVEPEEIVDYSLQTLTHDALTTITLVQQNQHWPSLPPTILIGHSLGGAIMTSLAAATTTPKTALTPALVGLIVLDVVEGSALEALSHMKTYLASRPSTFATLADGVTWHTRTRTIRHQTSASVSVPSLLRQTPSGAYTWRTDLASTAPWWESWFTGMSARFLAGRGAKMLVLAGTDRLDKELMIGQMQGKFQLVVLPEAGHFVQEDVPERVAELAVEFWRRNDRGSLVLPPKVSDLIAQGKKV